MKWFLGQIHAEEIPTYRELYFEALKNSTFSHFNSGASSFDEAIQSGDSYFKGFFISERDYDGADGMPFTRATLVGLVGLEKIRWIDRTAQLMCAIRSGYREKGYGVTATKLLLKEAVEDLNLRKISCAVLKDGPSMKGLEKMNFEIEGVLTDEKFTSGEYRDGVIFAWIKGRNKMPEV